ncbi:MAG TPA: beta-galactosidase [archaeon]|nr:beta-galactosidase [archaeon]
MGLPVPGPALVPSTLQSFSLRMSNYTLMFLSGVVFLFSDLEAAPRPVVFASFESEAERTAWEPEGGASAAVSQDFASWFDKSLKVTFPSGGKAGITTSQVPEDWQLHEAFRFFCYSSLPSELILTLKDQEGSRIERRIHLNRGPNHVQLKLARAGGIDLRHMAGLELSIPLNLPETVVYLDRFALDRFNEILARRGKMDIDYSREIVTPHEPLAKPLSGGSIRCLFVPDVENGRAVIELAQRLDLDYQAVTLGSAFATNIWGFGDFYDMRGRTFQEYPTAVYSLAYTYLADALLNGPHYDVIVIPGTRPWGEYPGLVRKEIARRVSEEGTGLVLVAPYSEERTDNSDLARLSPLVNLEKVVMVNSYNFLVEDSTKIHQAAWRKVKPHYITRNVPFEAFPFDRMHYARSQATGDVLVETEESSPYPIAAVHSYGQGRVVALAYGERGFIPRIINLWQVETGYPYWEYMYSLLARSVVWAAGRENEASIQSISLSQSGVASIEVKSPPAKATRSLQVVFRDQFGTRIDSILIPVPAPGSGLLKAKLRPDAPRGHVYVDVKLIEEGRVCDWGSVVGSLLQEIKIGSITFSANRFLPGENITGKIHLSGKKGKQAAVEIELKDNYGRSLVKKNITKKIAGSDVVDFDFDPSGALSHLVWVDCQIKTPDERLSDRKRAEVFYQRATPWDDFDIVMYLFGPDPMPGLWPTIESKLKDFYTTTLSSYPIDLCKFANFSVQAECNFPGQESPDGERRNYYNKMKKDYLATGDKHLLVREYCLSDPEYLALEEREIKRRTAPWVPFSPRSYYLYEEPSLTCYGDAVDICFSPHTLREMRRWLKERYGALDELNEAWGTGFTTWDAVEPDDSPEAQRRGNYASWADHRTFMEITYAGNYDYVARTLRKIDPNGIVLNSGTQIVGSHNGCDYWRLDKILGHLNPYSGQNQMDFHRAFGKGLKLSAGMGYGVSGRDVLHNLYSNLFEGCWAGCYVFWQYSVLDPDLTFCQSALDMQKGLAEIAGGGIARLLKNLPRGHDNIAIHYSMASVHGTWITDGRVRQEASYNTSQAFTRFVANREGWTMLLKDLGFQYNFLAYEEIEQGKLSEGYEVLILPMSVALSEREAQAIGRFVEAGGTLITDRFTGVMDDRCRWQVPGALDHVLGINHSKKCAPGDFTNPGPDPDISPQGLSRTFGKGRAFTLGYLLDDYPLKVRDGLAGPVRELVSGVLQGAGVRPPVEMATATGEPVSGITTATFSNGECTILGLLRENEGELNDLEFSASFPAPSHIYDVRKGLYLGHTGRIHASLATGEPALFALLPERPGKLSLQVPEKVVPGERLHFRVSLSDSANLHDVALIEVIDPQGRRHELYSTRIDLDHGSGEGSFPVALDDSRGRWMIRVKEVISGAGSEAFFDVVD